MTDGAALLKAVVAHPAEDTPRLAYADWLDEHGRPERAEFIRGQVRLSRMNSWDAGYTALDVRCRRQEREHPGWLGPLAPFVSRTERFCGDRDFPFARGFPWRARVNAQQFATHRAHLLDEAPVRHVQFDLSTASGGLARKPGLDRLTAVDFAGVRDFDRSRSFLACLRRLGPLEHFGLIGSLLSDGEAAQVYAAPAIQGVRSLHLQGTRLQPAAETALAALPLPNLRTLTRKWIAHLDWLHAAWVPQLEELTVYDSEPNLDADGKRPLADVLPGTAVRKLTLGWWTLGVPGARALAAAVARSRVRSLALAQTRLEADALAELLAPTAAANLHALYLSWAGLTHDVVRGLLGTPLRVLALDHVGPHTLRALAGPPGLSEVEDLRLGLVWRVTGAPFVDHLRDVLEAGTLPRLVSLSLHDTTPRLVATRAAWDRVAVALAECPAATRLRALHLPAVTATGARALAASPHLEALELLHVRVWPADPDAEAALHDRFGSRANLDVVSCEF